MPRLSTQDKQKHMSTEIPGYKYLEQHYSQLPKMIKPKFPLTDGQMSKTCYNSPLFIDEKETGYNTGEPYEYPAE